MKTTNMNNMKQIIILLVVIWTALIASSCVTEYQIKDKDTNKNKIKIAPNIWMQVGLSNPISDSLYLYIEFTMRNGVEECQSDVNTIEYNIVIDDNTFTHNDFTLDTKESRLLNGEEADYFKKFQMSNIINSDRIHINVGCSDNNSYETLKQVELYIDKVNRAAILGH